MGLGAGMSSLGELALEFWRMKEKGTAASE